MDLINNRYRVIANLSQDRIKSSYLVSDVINNHDEIQLNIINSEFASPSLIDFYVAEFKTLETVNHANICKVFDFGMVHTIDNQKVNNGDYFYTNEYIKNVLKLHEVIINIKKDNILDIFVKLCMVVNYLHLRGFIYGELNTNNIMISHENNKYNVIIKDLLTIEIEKQDHDRDKAGELNFKAPEYILDNERTIASDIYSMGIVLLALCNIDVYSNFNIDEDIENLQNKFKCKGNVSSETVVFYNNLIKIIKKMTQQNLINRYNNINEVVEDINVAFNKKYRSFITDEIEKLNFNTKIVGRDVEIAKIMNDYDNLVQGNPSNRIILVQGEQGIGKTRFLKEIGYLLYMKRANVYSSFNIENSKIKGNKAVVHILKEIVATSEDEIVKRYQSELIKFIPELGLGSNIVASESLTVEKEKYRLISRIYSFIKDSIVNKPTIFIIDNASFLDDFSLELLEYVNVQNYDDQNIMIILSYNKSAYDLSNNFQQVLNKNSTNYNVSLKKLDDEQTAIMLQQILNMPKVPSKFGKSVYKKTDGNPLFIEETLKDFVAKKAIYISEKNGKWYTTFDYDDMPIASTMEQALLNQIMEINEASYEILSVIAIFNTAVSIEVIEKFFVGTESKTEINIDELCSKGVLCKKIEDMGFVFDFYNKVLKTLIYNRLSEEERKVRHEFAASVLETIFEDEGRENKEELIYHLEKANDKDRIVKYCVELAEKMDSFRLKEEAIAKYEKALSMLSDDEDGNKKVEILLKVGDIYLGIGNLSGSLETYKKIYRLTMNLVEKKLQVDCANKIAYIYLKKNEVKKALKYIMKSAGILLNFEYMEGHLENKINLANVYIIKQEYNKSFDICTNCIKKCGNDYIEYKGLIYNILGIMYTETSRITQALDSFKIGLRYFEEINNTEGMSRCLNNIGVIYGDHYQDNETAIIYYNKNLVLCEENNIRHSELIVLTNIATSYWDNFDYNAALKYFKDVLEKSKNMELEGNIFYIYNYLSNVCLKIGNNKGAYENYLLVQKELEEFPIQGKEISLYYQMGAELHCSLGDNDIAYDLIGKALGIYNNDGTIQDNNSKLLLFILEIHRAEKIGDIKGIIQNVEILLNGYKNKTNNINAVYEICITLYENGYVQEATDLFESHPFSNQNSLADMVNIKRLYLEGIIKDDPNNILSLMVALNLSKKAKNKLFQWKICNAIGDNYSSKMDYFYAVNYYFEACEVIKDCTMQLPKHLRINYINAHNRMKPFNMIKVISKTDENTKLGNLEEITISSVEDLAILFNYDAFAEILNNKKFVESAQKIYSFILPKGINNINDVITNMSEDPLETLDVITKLISSMVLSSRSLIISEGNDNEYLVVASSDGNYDITDIKLILQRVRETKNSILLSEQFNNTKNVKLRFMPVGMKSIMCIPIISKKYVFEELSKGEIKRVNEPSNLEHIKGYLYMESQRVLNNFNEDSLSKCLDLTSIIRCIMGNYLLKISSSIDKLTGTLTRRFLEEELLGQVEKAEVAKGVFSIIMFDLDNFKGVNDRFGHQMLNVKL
ncbi:diguanylate cyclase [Clostridium sp.]|uniref:protein kinase domain-containing protein n=1 Tax=Clostridium sp. TaxID=1506 RepID=UPI001A3E3329|nr:diguanylate cyclase [Clostridium sp.]MBK5240660.1 diguanylate cyclase [Clostridium sp.]